MQSLQSDAEEQAKDKHYAADAISGDASKAAERYAALAVSLCLWLNDREDAHYAIELLWPVGRLFVALTIHTLTWVESFCKKAVLGDCICHALFLFCATGPR